MRYFLQKFKTIPCYVTSEVSLKKFYFGLFDDDVTLKTVTLAYIGYLLSNSSSMPVITTDSDIQFFLIILSTEFAERYLGLYDPSSNTLDIVNDFLWPGQWD